MPGLRKNRNEASAVAWQETQARQRCRRYREDQEDDESELTRRQIWSSLVDAQTSDNPSHEDCRDCLHAFTHFINEHLEDILSTTGHLKYRDGSMTGTTSTNRPS